MKVVVKSRLKEVRKQKGLSIRQLELCSGVSRSSISDIEREVKIPTIETLCMLAVAMEVRPEDLYSYSVE